MMGVEQKLCSYTKASTAFCIVNYRPKVTHTFRESYAAKKGSITFGSRFIFNTCHNMYYTVLPVYTRNNYQENRCTRHFDKISRLHVEGTQSYNIDVHNIHTVTYINLHSTKRAWCKHKATQQRLHIHVHHNITHDKETSSSETSIGILQSLFF